MSEITTSLQRVLIVDDEPNIRELLAEVLDSPSRAVRTAKSPAEALIYLQDGPVDLAILDMMMPGMTGLDLAERIKEITPETQIVLCTGYLAQDVRKTKANAFADHIVQKPFNLGEIMDLAEACMNH